ncbi:P2X purinoceptor 7-like [Ylistrum balloti]|uniref:P2X purinoceptor 7-like n=1 Tax=Ylistrum balloti TaxID=509963 RepID=UPI002905913E|nr:P2X purinoceptor 7-like [Ylistrum balloti]
MPTEAERVCCGKSRERCVSILPDFNVLVLDEAVLALARLYRNDVLVLNEEVDLMKANRHQGYRQFILWQHGWLGTGNRRVIPGCCVWRIRDGYPDPFGQYKGFVPGRLA